MKTLDRLSVHIIPIKEMPHGYTTQGYWEYTVKSRRSPAGRWAKDLGWSFEVDIYLCKMKDWRHTVMVFLHELVEVFMCIKGGITTEECDAFDEIYEQGYKNGTIPVEKEPGYDKKCPYYKGHVWGDRVSWFVGKLIGVNWKDYCAECDELIPPTGKS